MTRASEAEDRAIGALLGLACGDAVGTTLEFRPPGTFAPITDMVGGGPFDLPAGAWTDDTSMALCLAESMLDMGTMDVADQLRRYVLWRRSGYLSSTGECFDIGVTTSQALSRFERTGELIDQEIDESAQANGSLMRLAPVPIRWHADPAEAAEMAAVSSRPTHPATCPVDACRVLAAMTAALISGIPDGDVLAPDFWEWGPLDPAIESVAGGSWRARQPPEIRGSGHCVAALEAALWAVGGAADFADAVLRAANLGDDADTTAAIAGQLAGARWGATGIPARWRRTVVLAPRIVELAAGLHRAGGGAPTERWRHDDVVHAWWVQPGRVLAGEYPGDVDPRRAAERINLLLDAGVRTFVDLTTADDGLVPYGGVLRDAAATRRLGVDHERFGIPDLGVVEDADYDRILELVKGRAASAPVYVHCWGGIGRTGTVAGCLLTDDGFGHEAVIDRLATLRAGTRKANRLCPEAPAQHDVIRRRVQSARRR